MTEEPCVHIPKQNYNELLSALAVCEHLIEADRQRRDPLPKLLP